MCSLGVLIGRGLDQRIKGLRAEFSLFDFECAGRICTISSVGRAADS